MFVRRNYPYSQVELAKQLNLSLDQLSNIEIGRVALRAGTGWLLCKTLNINPRWIAVERGDIPMPDMEEFDQEAFGSFVVKNEDRSFSDVWSDWGLTQDSLKRNTAGVKSEIEKLIERVNKIASEPGMKAELSRYLDVAPARVSEWLSGKKEPGGNYTLRLLKWFEQQEHK